MRDGVINILKPPGMTSNDVVYDVRRILHIKRVGHTGTLDPGACGVLPVCVGRATRLFDYLAEKEKEYIAELTFGISTDTFDAYGRITHKSEVKPSRKDFEKAIQSFLGEIEQTAPMYSAVSVNGVRLYKLARKGIEVERQKRIVTIHSIDILDFEDNKALLKIRCSKGTYVRTLCVDLAGSFGADGYVSFLLRSASGRFSLENAVTLQELADLVSQGGENSCILPCDEALDFMPKTALTGEYAYKRLINGADIECYAESLTRVYVNDVFIGIGECENGRLHIRTQLCEV